MPEVSLRDLVGTWSLVRYVVEVAATSTTEEPFGPDPLGLLTYTAGGLVSVHAMQRDRPRCGSDRIVTCPPDVKIRAYDTHFSYVGRYTLTESGVVHHVEITSFPDWAGASLPRSVVIRDGLLTLTGPATSPRVPVLTWRREEDHPHEHASDLPRT